MFVILTGSSGVGKNTVIKQLQQVNSDIVFMPTYTTRDKRPGEVDGLPYYYITKQEFQDKIKNNEFIEYEIIHNNYYGSSIKIFDDYIKQNKTLIKDIGVEGAQNLCVKLKDKTDILKIFLTTKNKQELVNRLKGREEKQIKLRLKRYKYEQTQKIKFDYIIYNEDLNETIKTILSILTLSNNDYLSCKKLNRISKYKVKYYINKLNAGKILSPIKVSLKNGKAYIVKGVEKFVAGILSNKTVAKIIVNKQVKCRNLTEENWFKNII